ncbi:cation-translocating P-type ATPase [uncultured Gulosibacter sp.]|uniref:cation-translocating P-type ATPase n=1 Tax=uncultured Gulosibacter sp. TaxID=1339167 RepID=UPI00288B33DF|nr:cation-translocating P-type ATPase [uncultured Gulosibacter sp.]
MNTSVAASPATPWHARELSTVAAQLGVDPITGLTTDEAARRRQEYGGNELRGAPSVPRWRRFLEQFRDPLVYLLFAAVAISIAAWTIEGAASVPVDALVILVIILLNAVIGFVQEQRASEAVAALAEMSSPQASVIRDEVRQQVPSIDLVPGDIILLEEGNTVPADARILESTQLLVGEASLTGESVPVEKDATATIAEDAALGDRLTMVFSGTAVVQGVARAAVCTTAMRTEVGKIAKLLDAAETEATPLEREIAAVGRSLTVLVLLIALVVMVSVYAVTPDHSASSLITILLLGVSLAVAAVPEGLPAILSLVLALGVQRMAARRAIVKRLSSVETLGSATIICSDKTGTLTRNEMTIERVCTAASETYLNSYSPDATDASAVARVLRLGSIVNNAEVRFSDDAAPEVFGDPTEAAFQLALHRHHIDTPRVTRLREVPFTSTRKRMSALVATESGNRSVVAKGAPDVLIERCDRVVVDGAVVPLTPKLRDTILQQITALSAQAYRTLAIAARPADDADAHAADDEFESRLIWHGVVGIVDPPRTEVASAISEAKGAGIRVVMSTGDHPRTASRIATDLGVIDATRDAAPLTGPQLDRLRDDEFAVAVRETSVFARVAPEHKLRIVNALRAEGEVVAMTGDGVNDAPALKSADIGVAMGVTGTQVTHESADMILADDNFATIVAAVREGRGIFANIRKFLRYLLSSNMGEVLTMLLGVVLGAMLGLRLDDGTVILPLLATQILWINLLTDSLPALALGVDPTDATVMQHPPRRLTDRVIDGQMWFTIVFVGLVMAAATLFAFDFFLPGGLIDGPHTTDEPHARTVAFTVLVFAQLFNVFNCRSDTRSALSGMFHNRWLWCAIGISALLQVAVIYLPVLNHAFGTVPLNLEQWVMAIVLASMVLWADELRKLTHWAFSGSRS